MLELLPQVMRKVPANNAIREIKLIVVYEFLFTGGYYCFPLPCSLLLLCFRFLLLSAIVPVFFALFCYLPSGLLPRRPFSTCKIIGPKYSELPLQSGRDLRVTPAPETPLRCVTVRGVNENESGARVSVRVSVSVKNLTPEGWHIVFK